MQPTRIRKTIVKNTICFIFAFELPTGLLGNWGRRSGHSCSRSQLRRTRFGNRPQFRKGPPSVVVRYPVGHPINHFKIKQRNRAKAVDHCREGHSCLLNRACTRFLVRRPAVACTSHRSVAMNDFITALPSPCFSSPYRLVLREWRPFRHPIPVQGCSRLLRRARQDLVAA